MFGFIHWDINPIAFHLGNFGVHWYSLCWGIGLIGAYLLVQHLYRKQKIADILFEPLFMYCFIGILLGARLGDCLFYHFDYYISHPLEMILPMREINGSWKFTGYEGLASHGGTLGLIIALWLYVKKTKLNILTVVDLIAIATPFTATCIRIGNLFNSEIVGEPTTLPWGFVFNQEHFARHPSQLYEAIAYALIFILIISIYKLKPQKVGSGFFFGLCLFSIFTFRFCIESIKAVQVNFENDMFFNMGQLLSIPFIAIGLYCMVGSKWLKKIAQK